MIARNVLPRARNRFPSLSKSVMTLAVEFVLPDITSPGGVRKLNDRPVEDRLERFAESGATQRGRGPTRVGIGPLASTTTG